MKQIRFFLLLTICYLLFTNSAFGARLYFEELPMKDDIFSVAVKIDAPEPVSVVQGAVIFPASFLWTGWNDGGSIIPFWIEKPLLSPDKKSIIFSGMIPSGYEGESGTVATLHFLTEEKDAEGIFQFDTENTTVLEYSTTPKEVDTVLEKRTVIASQWSTSTETPPLPSEESEDKTPPEPIIARIGREENTYDGKYFIAFSSGDRDSGISHYEVAESREMVDDPSKLAWRTAESPYILEDGALGSFIYIKAVDHAGNERIEVLPPSNPQSATDSSKKWGIMVISALFFAGLLWVISLWKRRH